MKINVYRKWKKLDGKATCGEMHQATRMILEGSAAPVSGNWWKGDQINSVVATVGQPKGWICTADGGAGSPGTPGTWTSLGNY